MTRPVPVLQSFKVSSMVGLHDGTRWALYVAGALGNMPNPVVHVGRWDGQGWADLPLEVNGILALTVFDGGAGPALYAGGFTEASGGGSWVGVFVRWDGQNWIDLSAGVNGPVFCLAPFTDANGNALYVGGSFTQVGSIPANRIARWNGQNWSALGAGLDATPSAIVGFVDDPAGPALYAGGNFNNAGGAPASKIARWDGQNWSPLGAGTNGIVRTLAVFDDGTGPAVYASGDFSSPVLFLARWDGFAWSAVGPPVSNISFALAGANVGDGDYLYAAGPFTWMGGAWAPDVARWDGAQWSPFLDFVPAGFGNTLAVVNDGAPAIYMSFYANDATFARWGCPVPPTPPCYPNCDTSSVPPILNVEDFTCFINEFASALALPPTQQLDHYANCDRSTTPPVLNVNDFACFINAFAQGCP
jgi:hypothetical protein